jgi:hypothetical protein
MPEFFLHHREQDIEFDYGPAQPGEPFGRAGFDVLGRARTGGMTVASLRALILSPPELRGNPILQRQHYAAAYDAMAAACTTRVSRLLLLENIKTEPSHRRRGIATALLGFLLAWREWVHEETACLLFVLVDGTKGPSTLEVARLYELIGFMPLDVAGAEHPFMYRPPVRADEGPTA